MFSTSYRSLLLPFYLMGLAALFSAIPSCCEKKSDEGYDYGYDTDDSDTDDTSPPETVPASRDDVDDCLFKAVIADRGTAMLASAIVSASSGPAPKGVQLSKEGGDVATSGAVISGSEGEPGWSATFSATTLTGAPNPPIGTEIELDGTWVITLTVDGSTTCADIVTPLDLNLVTED